MGNEFDSSAIREIKRLAKQGIDLAKVWEDTDDDGVGELQKNHVDFGGGEARNAKIDAAKLVSALDAQGYDITNVGALDIDSGTVGNDPMLGGPATTSGTGLSLGGGWTTIDANNPSRVELRLQLETDGSTDSRVDVEIDESGGTTADYTYGFQTKATLGSGAIIQQPPSLYVPAGGTVRLVNVSDPNNGNGLVTDRAVIL